jgi:hypothetical protein
MDTSTGHQLQGNKLLYSSLRERRSKTSSRFVLAICFLILATGYVPNAAAADTQRKGFVVKNKGPLQADDLLLKFTKNVSQTDSKHSNEKRDASGVADGKFTSTTTPNPNSNNQRVKFRDPVNAANPPAADPVMMDETVTVGILFQNKAGKINKNESFWTDAEGNEIVGQLEWHGPGEKFSVNVDTGDVEYLLSGDQGLFNQQHLFLLNVEIWTGLTSAPVVDPDLVLGTTPDIVIGQLDFAPTDSGVFSLGILADTSFALVRYDLLLGPTSDIGSAVAVGEMIFGGQVPVPGTLSLLALGGLLVTRRRR